MPTSQEISDLAGLTNETVDRVLTAWHAFYDGCTERGEHPSWKRFAKRWKREDDEGKTADDHFQLAVQHGREAIKRFRDAIRLCKKLNDGRKENRQLLDAGYRLEDAIANIEYIV